MKSRCAGPASHAGDEVVLTRGSFQGTPEAFLHVNQDPNWTAC